MQGTSLLFLLLLQSIQCDAWAQYYMKARPRIVLTRLNAMIEDVPGDLRNGVREVAEQLWGDVELAAIMLKDTIERPIEGEAKFPEGMPFANRLHYFLERANQGDPRAQHSSALLLWSGFCGEQDAVKSAKWHAAAASQGHLESMAVLGGCLRKGVGVKRKVALGLDLISYCASVGNPSGINKKVGLLEEREDYKAAISLLEDCIARGRANALVYFNLGYFLIHEERSTVISDESRGELLWREAIDFAPDEGSEEAAYFLSRQPSQSTGDSKRLLKLAANLGLPDAIQDLQNL